MPKAKPLNKELIVAAMSQTLSNRAAARYLNCSYQHYKKENIELLCYNHYFLTVGDIFSDKQIKGMEDHVSVNQSEVEWEMDDYTRQRLEELGLGDEPEEDYISYK